MMFDPKILDLKYHINGLMPETICQSFIRFFQEKRANPTVTVYRTDTGASGQWQYGKSGDNTAFANVTVDAHTTKSARTYLGIGTAYTPCYIAGHYTAEAEL